MISASEQNDSCKRRPPAIELLAHSGNSMIAGCRMKRNRSSILFKVLFTIELLVTNHKIKSFL